MSGVFGIFPMMEMLKEFAYLGAEKSYEVVVTNPRAIAERLEDIEILPKGKLFLPYLENEQDELASSVWSKAHALYGESLPPLIEDRIRTELNAVSGKYDVIFSATRRLVKRSLKRGYLVGSRGAVASSLVAYLSGITDVNPLPPHYRCPSCKNVEFLTDSAYGCGADLPTKNCPVCGTKYEQDGFDIPYETFLGLNGSKIPDIDLNFSGEYQAEAHQNAEELFGSGKVFRAGTIGTIWTTVAQRYVEKYLMDNHIEKNRAEVDRLAMGCLGVKRTTGQHPGGLVVVPQGMDMEDFCPLQHPADDPKSGVITTHFEYHVTEDNLLKLDLLGHNDPTMLKRLHEYSGIDPRQIPLSDPDTMSIFRSSKILGYEDDMILGPTGATGVPEFNTRFMRQMLIDVQPQDFRTLIHMSGFGHGTDVWLGNAKDLVLSGTASALETIACRDNIMLYLISKGLDRKMSYQIMEAVRKGKIRKCGFEPGWLEELEAYDVPEWYIESLTKIGYLFPKAHATAYVSMAFRIAWYKVHTPLAFYAAYFTMQQNTFDIRKCCFFDAQVGLTRMRELIEEIDSNRDATIAQQDSLKILELCYEFYLRGFHFEKMHEDQETNPAFTIVDNGLRVAPQYVGE